MLVNWQVSQVKDLGALFLGNRAKLSGLGSEGGEVSLLIQLPVSILLGALQTSLHVPPVLASKTLDSLIISERPKVTSLVL